AQQKHPGNGSREANACGDPDRDLEMSRPVHGESSERGADHARKIVKAVLESGPPAHGVWPSKCLSKRPYPGPPNPHTHRRHQQPSEIGMSRLCASRETNGSSCPPQSRGGFWYSGCDCTSSDEEIGEPAGRKRHSAVHGIIKGSNLRHLR